MNMETPEKNTKTNTVGNRYERNMVWTLPKNE
jgi:hypothetical protein